MKSFSSIIVAFLILVLSACSTHEKVLKSDDINYKLTKGNEYYDAGKWYRANEVYQHLMPVFRGTPNYEELYYRFAYTFYHMKDYLSASYQFKSFVDHFPRSKRVQEMQFMYAKAMYLDAPDYKLDQSSTKNAIAAMQQFTSLFPDSEYVTEANNLIIEGREKLKKKDEGAAQLYYDMGRFKNAVTAFEVLTLEYPDAPNVDYYYYMMILSRYEYAKASQQRKQKERFEEVLNSVKELKDYFPKSSYIELSQSISKDSQNKIKQLSDEHK